MCKCKLCLQEKELKGSHLISKFFYDYIKKNSPTGGIRDINAPNRRLQDGIKVPFLCHECEEKFSKYETHFSRKYFGLLSSSDDLIDTRNDYLRYFILSLHWRMLLWYCLQDDAMMKSMSEKEKEVFYETLEKWRLALLNEDFSVIRSINMRLIPTRKLEGVNDFKNFFSKGVLSDFKFQAEKDSFKFAISYVQVPHCIFICEFWGEYPKIAGFKIGKKISIPKRITFPEEINAIIGRYYDEFIRSAGSMSPKQAEAIISKVKKD